MDNSIDFAELLRRESGFRSFEPWTESKTRLREYIGRVAQREIGRLEQEVDAVRQRGRTRLANAKKEFEEQRGKLNGEILELQTKLAAALSDTESKVRIVELEGNISQLTQKLNDSGKWWSLKLDNARLQGQLKLLSERTALLMYNGSRGGLWLIEKSFLPFIEYPNIAREARERMFQPSNADARLVKADTNYQSKTVEQSSPAVDLEAGRSIEVRPSAEPSVREAIQDVKQPWKFFVLSFYYIWGRLSPALTLLLFMAGMSGIWAWEKVHRQWLENGYEQLSIENKELKGVRTVNETLVQQIQEAKKAKEGAEAQLNQKKVDNERLTTTSASRDRDHAQAMAAMQKNIDSILLQRDNSTDKALVAAELLATERQSIITTKDSEIVRLTSELATAKTAMELANTARTAAENRELEANKRKNKLDGVAQGHARVVAFTKDALEQLEKLFKESNDKNFYNKRYEYRQEYRRRYDSNTEIKNLLQDALLPYMEY